MRSLNYFCEFVEDLLFAAGFGAAFFAPAVVPATVFVVCACALAGVDAPLFFADAGEEVLLPEPFAGAVSCAAAAVEVVPRR